MPPLPHIYHEEPVMFVASLRSFQHYRFTPDERIRLLCKLSPALKSYDEEDWALLFHSEVVSATLDLLFENEFCGYTKEEVLAWGTESKYYEECIPYLLYLLEAFIICLDRLSTVRKRRGGYFDEWRSDIEREAHVALSRSAALWKVLFELRGPLFCATAKAVSGDVPDTLGATILPISHSLFTLQEETHTERSIRLSDGFEMGFVLLHIWTRAQDAFVQQYTLMGLSRFLTLASPDRDPNTVFPNFYNEASTVLPAKTIIRSLRRDWKNEENCRQEVGVPIHTAMFLRSEAKNAPTNLDTPMERKLVLSSFGACRKQHCMERNIEPADDLFRSVVLVALDIMSVTGPQPREGSVVLPEATIHVIVPLIALSLENAMRGGDETYAKHLKALTNDCRSTMLLHQREATGAAISPELNALRACTMKYWKRAARDLGKYKKSAKGVFKTAINAWFNLEKALPSPTSEETLWRFPPLKRCNWEECLCSVHKPFHPLRVCRGCWGVAYCTAHCQDKDWEEGGHRTVCLRLQKQTVVPRAQ